MVPERLFSDRFSISPALLERLMGSALKGRVDDADIYLEYRVDEELVLEDGAVKKASRHVSQGAGVRAQSPEALRRELAAALKRRGPTLIEVPVGEMPDPWPTLIMPRVRGR